MDGNNNKKSSSKTYVITAIIVFITLVSMFVLLGVVTNLSKKKHYVDPNATTKKTTEPPVIVTNFSAPLSLVIGNSKFYGENEDSVRYSGAKFYFKCNEFDKEKEVCIKGSASMDVGTTTIELYSFDNVDDNYQTRSNEYHIIVSDNYIILTLDGKSSSGKTIVKNRSGGNLFELNNVTTKYKSGDDLNNFLYPVIDDNHLNYYICNNSKVKIVSADLTNNGEVEILEEVEDGICN